jgi:sialate O-acetylesterase
MGAGSSAVAQQLRRLVDLRGEWRFEIGDDPHWADPSFNDGKWTKLHVPGAWEEQGFPGYDGYGWYRKTVVIPTDWSEKQLYMDLGKIDDVDEAYVNGYFIGFRGQLPPSFITAYNLDRRYFLPHYCLKFGEPNVIAIRVYDDQQAGGMVSGEPAILADIHPLIVDQPLPTMWKFSVGDNMAWKSEEFDDAHWEDIHVPVYWETQGHKDYDGYGWYRVRFRVAPTLDRRHLILFLGKIDDVDEAYLNGERIGRTGTMGRSEAYEYALWRAYTIPPEKLLIDHDNVLAVRVYDAFMHGGIYNGPVGLVSRAKYLEWQPYQERRTSPKGPIQHFLDWLFE